MKNLIHQFIHNHQQFIGYLANLIAVGSVAFGVYSWLVLHTNGWLVAGVAWLACAALGLRVFIQNQRISKLSHALDTSIKTSIKLMESNVLSTIEQMQKTGVIPITALAVFTQNLQSINEALGKGKESQASIDEAFALLTECEARLKK